VLRFCATVEGEEYFFEGVVTIERNMFKKQIEFKKEYKVLVEVILPLSCKPSIPCPMLAGCPINKGQSPVFHRYIASSKVASVLQSVRLMSTLSGNIREELMYELFR
jgi:hypothetical protein